MQKGALRSVRALAGAKDINLKGAQRSSMWELYFVLVMVVAIDALNLSVPRVQEGAPIIVFVMVVEKVQARRMYNEQGRTDFYKARGEGKQCSWGHLGSEFSLFCNRHSNQI